MPQMLTRGAQHQGEARKEIEHQCEADARARNAANVAAWRLVNLAESEGERGERERERHEAEREDAERLSAWQKEWVEVCRRPQGCTVVADWDAEWKMESDDATEMAEVLAASKKAEAKTESGEAAAAKRRVDEAAAAQKWAAAWKEAEELTIACRRQRLGSSSESSAKTRVELLAGAEEAEGGRGTVRWNSRAVVCHKSRFSEEGFCHESKFSEEGRC